MKTALFTRIALALVALLVSTSVFAASDYLLELEGIKGECVGKHIKLTEQADGSWTAENIPSGTYKIVAKPGDGSVRTTSSGSPTTNFSFEGVISPRDVATGQSSGKRDHASGLATGKRQHKPFTISKRIDKMTPNGILIGEITVGDNGNDGDNSSKGQKTAGYDLKMAKKV